MTNGTIPALISTNVISRLLDSIKKTGVPEKVDRTYLKSIGFASTNDLSLIPLFKSLGFLDSSGKPTEIFRDYRAKGPDDANKVLGDAIKACYSQLFSVYPDAYRKDDEALTTWFRANIDKGEATQTRALKTFKTLCSHASFDEMSAPAEAPPRDEITSNGAATKTVAADLSQQVRSYATPDVTINITLQIAATNDATIYDKFFMSMRKHLFTNDA